MKPGVFLTFDVECSMGGAWQDPTLRPVPPSRAVWGEYDGRKLGLPLIVDILKQHGLAATFFVEAFMDEQGHTGQGEPICTYLLDQGQDVQLHIHPNHKHYGLKQQGRPYRFTDDIAELDPPAQRALLAEGAERLERWTGRRPAAFRAGNIGASEATLRELAAVGIRIDSSYSFPYVGGQCRFAPQEPYNGSKWYGDVLELALSAFRSWKLPRTPGAKPLDLMGISFEECRDAIGQICRAGADAVVILHSFSLIKVRNVQYDDGRLNRIVARRLRRLCQWLAGARELPTYTLTELAAAVANKTYQARHAPPCRLMTPRAPLRKAVQAWNNLYWT